MTDLKYDVWERYFKTFDGKCLCCGTPISLKNYHKGHIIADKNGGDYNINNLIPLCMSCNTKMGTIDYFTYKNKYFPDIKINIPIDIKIELLEKENSILREQIKISNNINTDDSETQIKNIVKSEIYKKVKLKNSKVSYGKAKKPINGFIFNGNEYKTNIVKDIIRNICDDFAINHKNIFVEKVISLKLFNKNPDVLYQPYKVKGTEVYVETNLSAKDIEKHAITLIKLFGYKENILKINYIQR